MKAKKQRIRNRKYVERKDIKKKQSLSVGEWLKKVKENSANGRMMRELESQSNLIPEDNNIRL